MPEMGGLEVLRRIRERIRMPVILLTGQSQDENKVLGLESGATSQHLSALRRVGLVESRRDGTSVFYRAADARVFDLLDAGRALVTRQLEGQQSLLRELTGP